MDTIELNGFELSVPNGVRQVVDGANYYALPDNTEYYLKLYNNRRQRCDVEVWIDGEKVGTWRINGYSSVSVHRPVNVNRKFVFVNEESKIARDTGNIRGKDTNGLIKVIFKPELEQILWDGFNDCDSFGKRIVSDRINYLHTAFTPQHDRVYGMNGLNSLNNKNNMEALQSMNDYSAGVTVLGERSNQHFDKTRRIENVDKLNITTIFTRLIVDKKYNSKKFIHLSDGVNGYETEIPRPIKSSWF